jgi:hypothetical protein
MYAEDWAQVVCDDCRHVFLVDRSTETPNDRKT